MKIAVLHSWHKDHHEKIHRQKPLTHPRTAGKYRIPHMSIVIYMLCTSIPLSLVTMGVTAEDVNFKPNGRGIMFVISLQYSKHFRT